MSFSGAGEGVEVFAVGFGDGVEVFLGGLDLGVAHAFHDGFEVGPFGEEPGGVGVAEVVQVRAGLVVYHQTGSAVDVSRMSAGKVPDVESLRSLRIGTTARLADLLANDPEVSGVRATRQGRDCTLPLLAGASTSLLSAFRASPYRGQPRYRWA